jgi:hypothetical protein
MTLLMPSWAVAFDSRLVAFDWVICEMARGLFARCALCYYALVAGTDPDLIISSGIDRDISHLSLSPTRTVQVGRECDHMLGLHAATGSPNSPRTHPAHPD